MRLMTLFTSLISHKENAVGADFPSHYAQYGMQTI